jgi:Carboxypeptidase regulatory-like domain
MKNSKDPASQCSPVTAATLLYIHRERMMMLSQTGRKDTECRSHSVASRKERIKQRLFCHHAFLIAVISLIAFGTAYSQSTAGSIRGAVQDKTGAVVPQAHVTLHSNDENTDRVVNADASGAFLLTDVKPANSICMHSTRALPTPASPVSCSTHARTCASLWTLPLPKPVQRLR